jgi:pyridoxine kinase
MTTNRVLSIQSHTVHGYVGQKASAFPLELLGIEVDPLNSVQLSNHKGYAKGAKGQVLQGDQLLEIVEGLDENGLLVGYTHLLTGYIGSVSFLRAVISVVKKLRDRNPSLIYYCDPVLGDHGKFYVPQELVAVYREEVLPLATVLTPNQFEIEQLTGMQISDESQAWNCCDMIHAKGVETVIITSCSLGVPDEVSLLASRLSKSKYNGIDGDDSSSAKQTKHKSRYMIKIPLIAGRYSGTGDLMAALLLAWNSRCIEESDFSKAIELSCASVHAIIRKTHESVEKGENPHRELRIIQSAQDILHPPVESLKMQAINRS